MNVWAIHKELSIKHFLIELVLRFGENAYSLRDHAEQFRAVEIYPDGRPDLSAYVYTFGQTPGRYAVDLLFPLPENNIVGANENLTLERLFDILSVHFE